MAYIFGSIWDRPNRNALNNLSKSVEHQGKSIQDLVAEGQLTPTQYAELVSIVNGNVKKGDITTADIDKNNFAIDQTMITDGLRSIITGNAPINAVPANNSIGTTKIIDSSITRRKRTVGGEFATVTFDGSPPNINTKDKVVEVEAGSYINTSQQRYEVLESVAAPFYRGLSVIVIYETKTNVLRVTSASSIYAIPEDAVVLMYLHFTDTSQNELLNVVGNLEYTVNGKNRIIKNSVHTDEIENGAITASKTNFIEVPNYFNKNDVTPERSVNSSTGEAYTLPNNSLTSKIKIVGEVGLYLKNISAIVCYDKNYEYLKGWVPASLSTIYTTHKDTEYIRVSARNGDLGTAMVYQGSEEKPYEPFGVKVLGVDITKGKSDNDNGNDNSSIKFPPEPIEAKFIAPDYDYTTMSLEEYYSAFDELVNKYPDNLKKKVFGKDMSGQYDVIQYHYIPTTYTYESTRVDRPKPKITFISNVHGFEKPTALATYYMIKSMLEDWRSNDVIEYLRSNVEMVFIAIANPYGYVNGTYKNGNPEVPVNIQTNFPVHWMQQDPSSNVYGGAEPLSENESQYISEMLEEHSDALFFVDSHASGSVAATTPEKMVYFIAPSNTGHYNEIIEESLKYSVENISRELSKNYMEDFEGVSGYYYLRPGNGTVDPYAASLGIPGYVLEIFYLLPGESAFYSPSAIKAMTETFANTLLTTLQTFKERS